MTAPAGPAGSGSDGGPAVWSIPSYGSGTLADVMPSAAAALGVPGYGDVLGVGPARQVVVLLVDGMGYELLGRHADAAPFLAGLMGEGQAITAGFPSTTVTSLASLGTGLPPGGHGLVGYTFALPEEGRVVNALRWDTAADPMAVQPSRTVFQAARDAGVGVAHLAPRAFAASGLTRAALRGADYPGAETYGELVQGTEAALDAGGRLLAYVYTGDLDNVGHLRGCGSDGWRAQLAHVDLLARQLAEALDPGAVLVVTADHGMVDVSVEERIDVDTDPVLQAGVREVGGEPRARHVYAEPGAADDVLAAWRERLAGRAVVRSRAEAVAEGWFGDPVADRALERIGDVVVAALGDTGLVATRRQPLESLLIGHHGSLTPAELRVPLLTVRA